MKRLKEALETAWVGLLLLLVAGTSLNWLLWRLDLDGWLLYWLAGGAAGVVCGGLFGMVWWGRGSRWQRFLRGAVWVLRAICGALVLAVLVGYFWMLAETIWLD